MKNYKKNDPKRLAALVKHLNDDAATEADKVTADMFTRAEADNCWKVGENCGESWYVLTQDEARELAKAKIAEDMWAFNADFVCEFIDTDGLSEWATEKLVDNIRRMQEDMCETCNGIIRVLVGNRFDKFVEKAIEADGLAHFLADYDDTDIDLGDGLYAYCE